MSTRYRTFDRSRLRIRPLAERVHDLEASYWLGLDDDTPPFNHPDLPAVALRLQAARERGAARILFMGAHLLRSGVSRHLIDLVERGWIDHVAMNGAGLIHDYELARIGATTESVARYIQTGEFGLWSETGELNDWITAAARADQGLGEYCRPAPRSQRLPLQGVERPRARHGTPESPCTVHAGLGYDILHEHPNFDGAALGQASYTDFLILAADVERLEGGVALTFGSAVMAPGSVPQSLGYGAQRGRSRGPRDPPLHHRRVRSGAHRGRFPRRTPAHGSGLLLPPP